MQLGGLVQPQPARRLAATVDGEVQRGPCFVGLLQGDAVGSAEVDAVRDVVAVLVVGELGAAPDRAGPGQQ